MDGLPNNLLKSVIRLSPLRFKFLILRQLVSAKSPSLPEILPDVLMDKNPAVRVQALLTIRDHHLGLYLPEIRKALGDQNTDVRLAAIDVLASFRQASPGRYLVGVLRDPIPQVRAAALQKLGGLDSLEHSRDIENCLQDPEETVRYWAVEALAKVGKLESVIVLRKLAVSDFRNQGTIRSAIRRIELRTGPEGAKRLQTQTDLIEILIAKDTLMEKRLRAKACLLRIAGEETLPLLKDALLKTNDTEIHDHIVDVLLILPYSQALQKELIHLIRHVHKSIRHKAIGALGQRGNREAIFFLSELIRESSHQSYPIKPDDAALAHKAVLAIEARNR